MLWGVEPSYAIGETKFYIQGHQLGRIRSIVQSEIREPTHAFIVNQNLAIADVASLHLCTKAEHHASLFSSSTQHSIPRKGERLMWAEKLHSDYVPRLYYC